MTTKIHERIQGKQWDWIDKNKTIGDFEKSLSVNQIRSMLG